MEGGATIIIIITIKKTYGQRQFFINVVKIFLVQNSVMAKLRVFKSANMLPAALPLAMCTVSVS